MTLFLISGIVGLLGTGFNYYETRRFVSEYKRRLRGEGLKKSEEERKKKTPAPPYGISAGVFESWLTRITDSSANFPATVLTAVAYSDLKAFRSGTGTALLLVATVAAAMFAIIATDPRRAPVSQFKHVSYWSWGLLAANAVGVGLALAQ